jgi:predicted enzyme related to lactoylglutathione lyase
MIGTWHGLIVNCPKPQQLAPFYAELLGYVTVQNEPDWVVIGRSPDQPGIAFQRDENFVAPSWPDLTTPTQLHIDIKVADLAAALVEVERLGGKLRSKSVAETFWVCADPIGIPFCLVHF